MKAGRKGESGTWLAAVLFLRRYIEEIPSMWGVCTTDIGLGVREEGPGVQGLTGGDSIQNCFLPSCCTLPVASKTGLSSAQAGASAGLLGGVSVMKNGMEDAIAPQGSRGTPVLHSVSWYGQVVGVVGRGTVNPLARVPAKIHRCKSAGKVGSLGESGVALLREQL